MDGGAGEGAEEVARRGGCGMDDRADLSCSDTVHAERHGGGTTHEGDMRERVGG